VVLVNECDQQMVLEDGHFSVGLVTTETLAADTFLKLVDEDLLQEQIEGTGSLEVEGGGVFNDLAPLAHYSSADQEVDMVLVNWCNDDERLSALIDLAAEPGVYPVGLFDPPIALTYEAGLPLTPSDDIHYIAVSGTVSLTEFSGSGGFAEGTIVDPITLARGDADRQVIDLQDTRRILSGNFRAWIRPE
jgi:hypothetical protein